MKRSRTATVLAAVTATILATGGATAAPANAGHIAGSGDAGQSYRWMTCPNGKPPGKGRITRVSLHYEALTWWLKFEGTIDRCVKPGRSDVFAIVRFLDPARSKGQHHARSFADVDRSGRFRVEVGLVEPGLRAACLSSREGRTAASSTRLDCVKVRWTARDQRRNRPPRIGCHLPTTHKLFARGSEPGQEPIPICEGCW